MNATHCLSGSECKKQYESLTVERKPEVKPEPKAKEEVKEVAAPVVAAAPAPPPSAPPLPPVPVPAVVPLHRENSSNSLETEDHFYSNSNGQLGVELPLSFNFPPPSFRPPPPTDFFGGWHQPFWNTPAASWLPPASLPTDPVVSSNNSAQVLPEKDAPEDDGQVKKSK